MAMSGKFFKDNEIEEINNLIEGMDEILGSILKDYENTSYEDRQLNRLKVLNMKLGALDKHINKEN